MAKLFKYRLSRRALLSGASALVLSKTPNPVAAIRPRGISIVDLRTEFVVSPLGVEASRPQLSWRIEAGRRGVRQSAYRIEVASSAEALAAGHADLWDTGRVASSSSVGIRYDGAAPSSRQRCFWRVNVWDERGTPHGPSGVAEWEMGLLEPTDWSARWLAAENQIMRDDRETGLVWIKGPAAQEGKHTLFRLSFSLPASGEGALFVSAYGKMGIWLDGDALALAPAPAFVAGPQMATVNAIALPAGRHVLGISVAASDAPLSKAVGFPSGEMAPFVRIRLADGAWLRFNAEGWKTALSDTADWQAVNFDDGPWDPALPIGEARAQPWAAQSAILLRHEFRATKPVQRARIYATALGAYVLQLNGKRVGDALLTPESTDFRKRALYRVYDVTTEIVLGENVLGAVVGDGWYASYTLFVGRYPWGPPPRRLLVQLELTYTDGSRQVIESGPGWQTHLAPIVSSELYDGEYYDARLEQPGWSSSGFDASKWEPAAGTASPSLALTAQIDPPIRPERRLVALKITEPRPGIFVFDFGQNFAGWCRLSVKGPAGRVVDMRFAELLKSDGEVDQSNLRSARSTDTYILKGDPTGETFEPSFTYHGFRYVQVTGLPEPPTADTLEGIVIHSDLKLTGNLRIDHPLIATFWHNTLWSQRSNFIGIPTDCPQRDERLGWMGDAHMFWDAAAFNMDVDAFSRRFMGDVRDAQAKDGAFSDFSPTALKAPGNRIGPSPGWADAGVCLPWTVWQRYGDTGIIEENWTSMARYLQFIHESNPDLIWSNDRGADYGDWLALDAKSPGDPTTPKDLLATAMWSRSVACMTQMAEATARTREATSYRALGVRIASAFKKKFIRADGSVGNGSQTGYVLALRYNLVPDVLRPAAAAKLVADIKGRGTLLSTGFLGTPSSLDVLADAGYSDLVYSLLLRTLYPSWGYMVAKGATTIWERWNGDTGNVSMNSFNHYALGAVCGFLFRRLAGIAPLEAGFRKIEVRPILDPRIKSGGGEYDSVLGRIATCWRQYDGGEFSLELTAPPNTSAVVYLPAKPGMIVREGRRAIACRDGTKNVRRTLNSAIIEVRSGCYRFVVES